MFCNSPGCKGKTHTVQKLQVVYKTFFSKAYCLTQKESVGLPKEKAEGGSNAATVFPTIACPLLVRKKINRGIIAAKWTKGAMIAASFDLEKKTDKKNPVHSKISCLKSTTTLIIIESHWNWTLELSFNSTGILVGSWLFCKQYFPCVISFLCMLGVGVGVWTKNIFIGSLSAKLTLAPLDMPKWLWFKFPHQLQAWNKTLQNTEHVVWKSANSC